MPQVFRDDEDGYLSWVEQHPQGWVVNTYRRPNANYLILHRATCRSISSQQRTNYTTTDFIKICSDEQSDLRTWARRETDGELSPCGLCHA